MTAMDVQIAVEGRLPRALGISRKALSGAARYFAARSAARSRLVFRAVSISLQDDAMSDAAHRAVMGVEGATDVITQRFDPIPPEPPGVYGELCVNCDMALRAGGAIAKSRKAWSPAKELLLYVAHGMDHLSGADDASPGERAAMRRRELGWLGKLETEGMHQ